MTKLKMLLATTAALAVVAYENKAGWKKTADGTLETDGDGNPIYLDADGKESTVAPGYITRLNNESAQHRKDAKDAQTKLAAFGDLDPKVAKDAVAKIKDVDFDALVNKGEIETVKTQMREQYETETNDLKAQLSDRDKRLNDMALDNAFKGSDFLQTRVAIPRDAAEALFRSKFKVEDGKVIPLKDADNPLLNKHGDVASVDEALEHYITARPDKDTLLKAPPVGGSGGQGGGGNRGGGNVVKRADFNALPPMEQAAVGQRAAKGEIAIVD